MYQNKYNNKNHYGGGEGKMKNKTQLKQTSKKKKKIEKTFIDK